MARDPFEYGGGGTSWNYSDDSKANYSETLAGTVVEISYVQKMKYGTNEPEYHSDGNPKTLWRFSIVDTAGNEFTWWFSTNRDSNAVKACGLALLADGRNGKRWKISELLGKFVVVSTKAGSYNMQRPRPWKVEIKGNGDQSQVRGCYDEVNADKPQPASEPNFTEQAAAMKQMLVDSASAPAAPAPAAPAPAAPAPAYDQVPLEVYAEDIPF